MGNNATISVEEAFKNLLEYVAQFDPIKLLTQLTLTYLRVPADDFIGEDHDVHRWAVRIEFLAGALLVREFPSGCDRNVTGQTLERIEELLDAYYSALMHQLLLPERSSIGSEHEHVLRSVRSYALWVRGEAHQHQYYDMARGIYGLHDEWFKSNLGFTINDVITAVKGLLKEYSNRINSGRRNAVNQAEEYVNEHGLSGDEKKQSKINYNCYLFFGKSDELLAFTPQELSNFSGLPKPVCIQILNRLSQEFGYRNPRFTNTFYDPNNAPWDYNTLYERPFICRDGRYWMVLPSIIGTVVLTTFYFDLMQDIRYRPTFEKGPWRLA